MSFWRSKASTIVTDFNGKLLTAYKLSNSCGLRSGVFYDVVHQFACDSKQDGRCSLIEFCIRALVIANNLKTGLVQQSSGEPVHRCPVSQLVKLWWAEFEHQVSSGVNRLLDEACSLVNHLAIGLVQ